MDNNQKRAKAPYNFVPFSNLVVTRYASRKDIPSHRWTDGQLCTGEIHVRVEARSPVMVKGMGNAFYRTGKGELAIPGSSFRGLLRENMQILSFSKVNAGDDLQDRHLFFRNVAGARNSLSFGAKTYYSRQLGDNTSNLKTGILRRVGVRKYVITPSLEGYQRVKLDHPDVSALQNLTSCMRKCWYTGADEQLNISMTEKAGWQAAYLLRPGRMASQKHIYLIPDGDRANDIALSEESILQYELDYDIRSSALGANKDFWKLPESGQEKPVFYLDDDTKETITFGYGRYIRIPFPYALSEGLPQAHQEPASGIDYTGAMMGFVRSDCAYKSRISVGDLTVTGRTAPGRAFRMAPGAPKPTFFAAYTQGGKDYSDVFKLSGYKQYWIQASDDPQGIEEQRYAASFTPLPAGTVFTGTVRYKNLHPDELGLLLWSLTLSEESLQNMGLAKAYGLGIIKVTVDQLIEYDLSQAYSSFAYNAPPCASAERIAELRRTFEKRILDEYNARESVKASQYSEIPVIADLLFMKKVRVARGGSPYMTLAQHRNLSAPLATVRELEDMPEDQLANAIFMTGPAAAPASAPRQGNGPARPVPPPTRTTAPGFQPERVTGTVTRLLWSKTDPGKVYAVILDIGKDVPGRLFLNDGEMVRRGDVLHVIVTGPAKQSGDYINYPLAWDR